MNLRYLKKTKSLTILALLLLTLTKVTYSFALPTTSQAHLTLHADTAWDLYADQFDFRDNGNRILAAGDVSIITQGTAIFAQEALYNKEKGIIEVTGDVRFESKGDILTGERGTFDLNNHTGRLVKGRLFLKENHYYIESDVLEKIGENTYYVRKGRLTTCDGDPPAWSITCSEVKVTIEGYGTLKHAAFRIHDIPVLYVPYMIFPAKTKRQSGLLPPTFGYSERNGMDTEIPFFWAISDQTDATFYERYMTERGYMQGLEFRYVAPNDSKGTFLYDVLSDSKIKNMNDPDDLDVSPFPRTNETRYWFRSRIDQQLPYDIKARLDLDFVSDQDYLREFNNEMQGFGSRPDIESEFGRPLDDARSVFRRSALRLDYTGEGYSVQAQGAYYQTPEDPPDDQTPQPLAGLDYSVLPRPVSGFPLFFSLDTDYDYVWREYGQKGHRSSLTPKLSYPLWFGRYLELEPSFSYTQVVQQLDDESDTDQQTKGAYDAQTRLSTAFERIFEYNGKEIKRLKHKIVPSLIYQYRVPEDDEKTQPWVEPIDMEGKINRVTFMLENFLDARKEIQNRDISYHQWGTISLSQGYDLDEVRRDVVPGVDREPFDPLIGSLTIRPVSFLNVETNAYWDHYDKTFTYTDASIDLSIPRSAGRLDTFTIDYEHYKEGDRNINYNFGLNLLYGLSIGASLKRDLVVDENIEQTYWMEYTSQCWGIRLTAEETERDTSYMLTFRLLGLGDIRSR